VRYRLVALLSARGPGGVATGGSGQLIGLLGGAVRGAIRSHPRPYKPKSAGAIPPEQHIHIEAAADESNQYTLASFLGENLNQWSIVFLIFAAEILMCTAIVVPGPISFRRQFMNQLAKLWNEYPRFRLVTKTVMFIIGGFFLDALRHMYMLYDATSVYGPANAQVPGAGAYTINKDAYLGFYKAERNAYLCGTTIFLFFMLYRFAHMTHTLTLLENKLASLETTSATHYRSEKQIKDDVGRPIKNKLR